jgi:hypothetical protein
MTVGDGGGCAGPGKGDTGHGGGREGAVGGQRFGDGTVKRDAACERIEKKQVIRLSLGSTQSAFVKRGIPSWGPTYARKKDKKASLRASQSISFQKISSSILVVHGVCRGSKPKSHRRQADEEARSLL